MFLKWLLFFIVIAFAVTFVATYSLQDALRQMARRRAAHCHESGRRQEAAGAEYRAMWPSCASMWQKMAWQGRALAHILALARRRRRRRAAGGTPARVGVDETSTSLTVVAFSWVAPNRVSLVMPWAARSNPPFSCLC
jgi:hypothetical protein